MTDEGYLQNKIRELKDEVEQIKNLIEEEKKGMLTIRNEFTSFIETKINYFLPLIELSQKMDKINETLHIKVEDQVNKHLDEFDLIIQSKTKNWLKESIKLTDHAIRTQLKEDLKEIDTTFREYINGGHKRIDNLIEILNKRGITNITSIGMNENTGKIKTFIRP